MESFPVANFYPAYPGWAVNGAVRAAARGGLPLIARHGYATPLKAAGIFL